MRSYTLLVAIGLLATPALAQTAPEVPLQQQVDNVVGQINRLAGSLGVALVQQQAQIQSLQAELAAAKKPAAMVMPAPHAAPAAPVTDAPPK